MSFLTLKTFNRFIYPKEDISPQHDIFTVFRCELSSLFQFKSPFHEVPLISHFCHSITQEASEAILGVSSPALSFVLLWLLHVIIIQNLYGKGLVKYHMGKM